MYTVMADFYIHVGGWNLVPMLVWQTLYLLNILSNSYFFIVCHIYGKLRHRKLRHLLTVALVLKHEEETSAREVDMVCSLNFQSRTPGQPLDSASH